MPPRHSGLARNQPPLSRKAEPFPLAFVSIAAALTCYRHYTN
ncbi:hypothetical protein OG301_04900 [Streptomyces platensis]|nr:hypothetical protein OG229_33495 [Streptomyces platensis]WTI50771.1 hypothetical protein OG301_04900 [Streptomyces platensis]WUB83685.1 hypothetical protein OG424_33450 [Streptomyces platensis]